MKDKLRKIFTHRIDLNRRHHRNDKNNVLFVNVETIRLDPNTVHHNIHIAAVKMITKRLLRKIVLNKTICFYMASM